MAERLPRSLLGYSPASFQDLTDRMVQDHLRQRRRLQEEIEAVREENVALSKRLRELDTAMAMPSPSGSVKKAGPTLKVSRPARGPLFSAPPSSPDALQPPPPQDEESLIAKDPFFRLNRTAGSSATPTPTPTPHSPPPGGDEPELDP